MQAKDVTVRLDAETADAIHSLAAPFGMSIEEYLKKQFGNPKKTKFKNIEEIDAWLNGLSEGLPDLPVVESSFSREDLYSDHD